MFQKVKFAFAWVLAKAKALWQLTPDTVKEEVLKTYEDEVKPALRKAGHHIAETLSAVAKVVKGLANCVVTFIDGIARFFGPKDFGDYAATN